MITTFVEWPKRVIGSPYDRQVYRHRLKSVWQARLEGASSLQLFISPRASFFVELVSKDRRVLFENLLHQQGPV